MSKLREIWDRKARDRRSSILTAAVALAESEGYLSVTRAAIADRAGVAQSHVSYMFGSMPGLRRELMNEAVRCKNLRILAQGLAADDPTAGNAPASLKKLALETLL